MDKKTWLIIPLYSIIYFMRDQLNKVFISIEVLETRDMLLCKKIKIEVSKQDAETLEFMQNQVSWVV